MDRSDKQKQIKNAFLYMIPMGIGGVLYFLTLPLYTRILSKEEYGVLALVEMFGVFFASLVNWGLLLAYERNFFTYRHDKHKSAQLLYSVLAFVVCSGVIFSAVAYVLRAPLSWFMFRKTGYGSLLLLGFFANFVISLLNYYLCYFKNSENAKSFVMFTIVLNVLTVALTVVALWIMRWGVIGVIYAKLIAACGVSCAVGFYFLRLLPFSLKREMLIESLQIGFPLTPRLFLSIVSTQFDKYMINLLSSLGGVGIYSIGQTIAYQVFAFMTALEQVFVPRVYSMMFDAKEKGAEFIGRYLTPFAYVSIFVALLVALFSREIIVLLTPASFHGASDIVAILAMYYAFLFFGKQPQLAYAKKTWLLSLLSIVSFGLTVAFNIPLIHRWGALGAAWATLLSGLLSGSIFFVVSQYYYRIDWDYRVLGLFFVFFFSACIVSIQVAHASLAYPVQLMLKIFFIGCFGWFGIRRGIVSREHFGILTRGMMTGSAKTA